MFKYRIADLILSTQNADDYISQRLEPFLYSGSEESLFNVDFQPARSIPVPAGQNVMDDRMVWLKKGDNGYFSYLKASNGDVAVATDSSSDWKNNVIYYLKDIATYNTLNNVPGILSLQFFGLIFRNFILHHDGIVLHASCISNNGRGIAFTAPSGTGKSTHTRLWEKYKSGSAVINDDTPTIRIIDGKPVIYGTPWSGSTEKFINERVPLSAIVIIEQAPENSILRLGPLEAINGVMPRLLMPYFDSDMMELAINTIDKIISLVPVYKLRCRPDQEAVETVYQCIG